MTKDIKDFLVVATLTILVYSIGFVCGSIIQSRYQQEMDKVWAIEEGAVMPRLIGMNCSNAGGDIWAMEESDFPTPCKSIQMYP